MIAAARRARRASAAVRCRLRGAANQRNVAVLLPRADESRAHAFAERVTAALAGVRCATVVERGALTARVALDRQRRELSRMAAADRKDM